MCSTWSRPGSYSETTAYSSLSNLDLYVKYFYGVLYANADINCGSSCLMDDGVTDLVKYSWYNVSAGTVNKFFYQPNFVTEQSNFRSNWSAMYTWISKLNEYLEDLNKGLIRLESRPGEDPYGRGPFSACVRLSGTGEPATAV